MMNKMKSARVQIIRFLFVLPLIAVLLLAFREVKLQERKHDYLQPSALLTDTVPAENISSVNVTKNNGENNVRIVLKDGTVENYNLNDAKQKATFEKKYGKLKPPPPPPAAPSMQVIVTNSNEIETVDVTKSDGKSIVTIRLKNGTVETYDLNDPKQKETLEKKYGTTITTPPPPPPPPVETLTIISPAKEELTPNEKGYYLSVADNNGECVVIIKDKKKKIVEALTLTDWNKKETFYKNKYGDIPPPPPPVPGVPAKVSVVSTVSSPAAVSVQSKVSVTSAPSPVKEVTVVGYPTQVAIAVEGKPVTATVKSTSPAATLKEVTVVGYATGGTTATVKKPNPGLGFGKGTNAEEILYIVDGKETKYEEVGKIDPDNIESINVLKGESATKVYGEKGKNGVILIKTKIKTAKRNLQIFDKVNVEPDK